MNNSSNPIRTMVCLSVCALCLMAVWSMPAQAQDVDARDYVLWRKYVVMDGLNACSQSEEIRLNLAFSAGLVRAPAGTPARVNAFSRIMDMNGRVLFTGSNETITVNGMRTESVSRAELDVPQTGPLTLLVEWAIDARRDFGTDLPASAEVVDGCTGRVKYHTGQGLTLQHDTVPGRSNVFAVWVTVGFQPVSLADGQTLRLNIEQQWPLVVPTPTAAAADYFLKIEGLDSESRTVDERHLNILPGQTLVMDFNRDLIREPGDSGTGRLTVWLVAEYRAWVSREQLAQMSRQGTAVHFPASLHLLDNNTPSAIGLLLPAVQKVREAACGRNGC